MVGTETEYGESERRKERENKMKEVTRIFTVEITSVTRGNVEDLIPHGEAKESLENDLKKQEIFKDADDIKVVNVQDFVRDVQTNYEKIKFMDKTELAKFLERITKLCFDCAEGVCEDNEICCPFGECRGITCEFMQWLDEEAK